MVAGPSEILVIADGQNDPDWIAADLLSQAEHDPSAQSILITDDAAVRRAGRGRGRRADARRSPTAAHRASELGRPTARSSSSRDLSEAPAARQPPRRRASSSWRSTIPRRCSRRSAMPAACSSAATRPKRSATMSPGPTTCCRPAAARASPAGLSVLDFMKRTSFIAMDAARARRRSARPRSRWPMPKGLPAHAQSVEVRLTDEQRPRRSSRSAARLAAVQALYQHEMEGTPRAKLLHEFHQHRLGATIEDEHTGRRRGRFLRRCGHRHARAARGDRRAAERQADRGLEARAARQDAAADPARRRPTSCSPAPTCRPEA